MGTARRPCPTRAPPSSIPGPPPPTRAGTWNHGGGGALSTTHRWNKIRVEDELAGRDTPSSAGVQWNKWPNGIWASKLTCLNSQGHRMIFGDLNQELPSKTALTTPDVTSTHEGGKHGQRMVAKHWVQL